jgi:hypothetical protein
MWKGNNLGERSDKAINKIFGNQNSESDIQIAKNIIEKVIHSINDPSKPDRKLDVNEKTPGTFVVNLQLILEKVREYQIYYFDLRTTDLTQMTERYFKEEITKNLERVALGTI